VTQRLADPSSRARSWAELMRDGEFESAWRLGDTGLRNIPEDEWRKPRHEQRIWRGQAVAGREVLVRCYHGLGDTLQYVRYLPRLTRAARRTVVWVQPELIPLLSQTPGMGRLLPLHDGVPDVTYDVDVEIMELSHVFRSTVDTLPRDIPYIALPHRGVERGAGTRGMRVGLAWRAGSWDPRRSAALVQLTALREVPGIEWVPLHGVADDERDWFSGRTWTGTIAELASEIDACDLVVTVDTMAAHLAGALGVNTCLMLHADADWRWMRNRNDSPWYPSMTLYRQNRLGDWRGGLDAIQARLRQEAACPGRRPLD